MRIGMAGIAGESLEAILARVSARVGLMASAAVDARVLSRQAKARFHVTVRCEGGLGEAAGRVAEFAAVVHWRRRKLSAVAVGMARRTGEFAIPINGAAAGRLMALGAVQRDVLSCQRKCASAMRHRRERGRLEAGFVVADAAIGTGFTMVELPSVRILVTIAAAVVSHGFVKVVADVAGDAPRLRVLPGQSKARERVVENP
jgi:hypothetical protein